MAAPKNRSARSRTAKSRAGAQRPAGSRPSAAPRPRKELKPWQLAVFIVLGLVIAGVFVGVGFVKKSHDEYGQWPWARTAVPPTMYYDHRGYKDRTSAALPATPLRVGKTPGGGLIFATTAVKKPVPTVIWVQDPTSHAVSRYALSGGP